MILVCSPDAKSLGRIRRKLASAHFSWAYLGQSLVDAKRAERYFSNHGTFVDATTGFHQAAEMLRGPYLEYIYNIGEHLASLRWWISSVSCRSGVTSKSFQQVCYLQTALKLVEQWSHDYHLVLVLDEAVLPALARNIEVRKQRDVEVLGKSHPLVLRRLSDPLIMLGHRAFFLGREVYRVIQARRLVPRPVLEGQPSTVVFSWATSETFKDGVGFHKTFYGDLVEELGQRGCRVAVVPIIWKELDYSAVLSSLSRMEQPLLAPHRYLRIRDLVHAAIATTGRPRLPSPLQPFEGMDIEPVIEADLQHHWISNAAADALLTGALIRRWSSLGFTIERFIYIFENQPYERALCWEAKRRFPEAAIVGYQHARAPWMAINMYQAKGGEPLAPQPHRIMTVGAHTAGLLTTNGNDPEQVKVGGALQMGDFFRFRSESQSPDGYNSNNDSGPSEGPVVLVACSSRLEEAAELVDMASQLLRENGGVRMLIKCHPVMPFAAFEHLLERTLPSNAQLSDTPIHELILKSAVIVYTSSITCVQALALGVPVIHLRTRFDLDLDPLDSTPDSKIQATDLDQLREQVCWVLEHRDQYVAEHREQWERLVLDMYGPVTEETYQGFLAPIPTNSAGDENFADAR